MNKKHVLSLSLTLIIVMLFSALGPTTVYADDGAPADTTSAETTEPNDVSADEGDTGAESDEPGESEPEQAVSEEAMDESTDGETDVAATQEAVTEEVLDGAADAAATEEAVTEEASSNEADEAATEEPSLMEQVPDNTEVVVVNAEGETEPLATQEAAEAVVESDPIWCPAGQGPTPGANGCTGSFSSFDALLTELEGNATYQGAGTIYVEMGTYNTSETSIDFNNYNLSNISNANLTIQGGWNTGTGTTTDTTTFAIPMVIGSSTTPWGGSLTLNNIIISGVVGDTGLTVFSSGDVLVENSTFTNNDVAGAVIDAGGDVEVRNSNVSDNGSNDWNVVDGDGLIINSGGYVTLNGVTANDNQLSGANITAATGVAIANSTFNGNLMYTTDFAEFFGYGLTVVSQGDISLSGVEANDNFLWGAWLDGPNVFIENSFFNLNVSDSVSFIDDTGLIIVTTGDVSLDNIEANENRMIGADIYANGQVDILNSSFNNNFGTTMDASGAETYWGCGLQVAGVPVGGVAVGNIQNCDPQGQSASTINLDTVTADGNYLYGADLLASGTVNISGSSFSGNATPAAQANAQGGLMVQSGSDVTLEIVAVNDNGMFGADIVSGGTVDITDSTFSNNVSGNGLSITSTSPSGIVNLTNVIATGNGQDGAFVETNTGFVCLEGGQYINNGQYGVQIVNSTLEISGAPVFDPNAQGNIFGTQGNCPGVIFTSVSAEAAGQPGHVVTALTESQLPGSLGQGNTFVSALQVSGTSVSFELSFPIPAGMENADLAVMFWDGSTWVEVPGGSVVGSEFVITVSQPGVYVLVSQ